MKCVLRSGCDCFGHCGRRFHFFAIWLLSALADIDAALEVSAIFDYDAGGLNVTHELGVFLDEYLIARVYAAFQGSHHHHFASLDAVHEYFPLAANRQPVIRDVDGAFHVAFNDQVFLAGNLALDDDAAP